MEIESKKLPIQKIVNILLIIGIVLTVYYILQSKGLLNTRTTQKEEATQSSSYISTIIIDVEGAVTNPGVFEIDSSKRINDALLLAGGFSNDVDYQYTSKTLNKSEKLKDGMKIYIPHVNEDMGTTTLNTSQIVNINSAPQASIENLDGIGSVTAEKIITNRPYTDLNDLISKKVINSSQAEKIKDAISF